MVSPQCEEDIRHNPPLLMEGRALKLNPMPGVGTTKDENHPHPSLPRRGGGIQGGEHFHINGFREVKIWEQMIEKRR